MNYSIFSDCEGSEIISIYKQTDLCHVRFLFNVGSYYEDDSNRGISHLIEHLMFNCCPGISAKEFNRKMDAMGMQVNASTSREFTRFYFTGLKENFKEAFELYFSLLNGFSVTEDILKKEVGVVCNEIGVSKDDNWSNLYEMINSQAYKFHPVKNPILGYEDVLRNLTVEDVQNYYDSNYCAENLKCILVGDFTVEDIEWVKSTISSYKHGQKNNDIVINPNQIQPLMKTVVGYKNGIAQTFLASFLPFTSSIENVFYGFIAASVIGGSMSSYLWDEFREKRSLCYTIGSYTGNIDMKNFRLHMFSSLNNYEDVHEAIELFKDAISYVHKISEEEFQKGLTQVKTSHLISCENIDYLASLYEDSYLFSRNSEIFGEYVDFINRANFSDFQEFTCALNVDDLVTGIIYPQEVQGC